MCKVFIHKRYGLYFSKTIINNNILIYLFKFNLKKNLKHTFSNF